MTITTLLYIAMVLLTLLTIGILIMSLKEKEYKVSIYISICYVVIVAVVYVLFTTNVFQSGHIAYAATTNAVEQVVAEEKVDGEEALEDTEDAEATSKKSGLGKQVVILLGVAAGVGALAAIYGVSSIVAPRTKLKKSSNNKTEKTVESTAMKEDSLAVPQEADAENAEDGAVFRPEDWMEIPEDGKAYEVTLDEDGNIVRRPVYKEYK